MPRYVFDSDEIEFCNECPCFVSNYLGEMCGVRERGVETSDGGFTWTRPEWCPLVRLD